MPIERKQFDTAQDNLTIKVLDFLRLNKDFAFTADEIAERLGDDALDVQVTLTRLVNSEELLERKMLGGEYYYAIKRAITRFLERVF